MSQIQFIVFFSVSVGLVIGIFGVLFILFKNVDAILHIDSSDPEKDKYNFMVLCPLEDLHKKKYLIVEVKNTN